MEGVQVALGDEAVMPEKSSESSIQTLTALVSHGGSPFHVRMERSKLDFVSANGWF